MRCVKKYAKLQDVLFNGSKSKLLVYNKKDADPHFDINGTDVSHMRKLYILEMYFIAFTGIKKCNCNVNRCMSFTSSCIKKCNCNVNRCMSEFGSLVSCRQKQHCFIGIF